jgi:hypothetical protein
VIEADTQYRRRRQKWPLLLADDWTPRRHRPIRQSVCAERPYNVVNLGPASERVLSILEGARVQFNVEVFRDDYETISAYLDGGHRPSTRTQWRNYRALKGFVASYRRLYRQTEAIPVETIDLFGSPVPILRTPWIRSRFFRARNRRYHATNFWPERVHKEFRERWFSFAVHVPGGFDVEYGFGDDEITGGGFTPARTKPGRYVERDIVTSQIQTLAVFLGLEDLEALATSERPTLKEWLADRLWTQHRELLADGYEGEAGYTKLVAFAKAHLMRFYGGDLGEIIRKCGRNTDKYGPGWKTSRGLWAKPTIKPGTKTVVLAKSGVTEAVERATEFFLKLPPWIDALETFLEACRTLAETRPGGVAFHDPLDGAEVRWHHAQRGVVHVGHEEIEVHPPGTNVKLGFLPAKPGAIDRTALKRFVTPCLTHLMDAFFSGLVLDQLHSLGADVVALHDAWQVPERLPVPEKVEDEFDESMGLDGSSTLKNVIEQAGSVWFRGLGGLYDQLVTDLGDHGTFGPFVHEIRDRWRKRVEAQGWPTFLSH